MKTNLQPWRDRRGRLSSLRILTLLILFLPLFYAIYEFQLIVHDARPLNNLIHRSGYWSLVFLLASLAITPLRRIGHFSQLLDVRRMIGVASFIYAFAHILFYIADQMFDLVKIVTEISSRIYLIIGFTALLGLLALTITSTDGMIRRLGALRWNRLHKIVYAITLLVLVHYFQQTKADISVPTFAAGLFSWLIGYRLAVKYSRVKGELPILTLILLSVINSAFVFVGEAIGIAITFNISPWRVLQLAFDFENIRPGWLVLAAGLSVVVIDLLRTRNRKPQSTKPATPVAVISR